MTDKRPRPPGEEPEMTFEAPDTVPLEAVEDDPKRRPRDLGTVAVGTVGFAASGAIDPGSTSAAVDHPGEDPTPLDDSLDVFDTLQPEDGPDVLPNIPPPDTAVLNSIYGAQSTAGGGFNLTDDDPNLDFAPIDFTIAAPSSTEPDTTPDITTGATSFVGGGQPVVETPDDFAQPPDFLDTDTDIADFDILEDDGDDDGEDEDLGG